MAGRHALEVLGDRRLSEKTTDQAAEFLKPRRLAEVHRVGLDRLPADEEVITALGLDAALQLVRDVTLDAAEDRLDLGEDGLELRRLLRLDVQNRDFQNQILSPTG